MNYPLAIFTPHIGAQSETFIRQHIEGLLPGRTVVVAANDQPPIGGRWSVNCPKLIIGQVPKPRLRQKVIFALQQKLGWQPSDEMAPVRRFLQKAGVKVILGEYLDVSLLWLPLAKELGIRFFAHAHGWDVSQTLRMPEWQKEYLRYNNADGVITMSNKSFHRLTEIGLNPAKVHVVPCGVDVPSKPRQRETREMLRCLAVGRMVAKKAPIMTLDAFRRAAERYPNVHLDYVGAGELLPAVRHFIQAFNLSEKVTLHGEQSSEVVKELMCASDVFLQHSMIDYDTGDEEGLPVAILEAMAAGLPVVSTRHAGIPEAVQDGITGYLVEEGDSASMGNHIITLAQDPCLRRRFGEVAWDRANTRFSREQEKCSLLKILGLNSSE